MKKYFVTFVATVMCVLASMAQEASPPSMGSGSESIDLVVLLDSSQSMFAFNDGVRRFILERVARDYLRLGDSFHLLSFADVQKVELSRVYDNKGAAQDIVSRLYLNLPLGQSTDLLSSIDYLYQYVDGLPNNGSRRLVVIISDLIHNPAAGSTYRGVDLTTASTRVKEAVQRMRARDWSVIVIKIPEDLGILPGESPGRLPNATSSPASAPSAEDRPSTRVSDGAVAPSAVASGTAPTETLRAGSAKIKKEEGGSGLALSGTFDELGREGSALIIDYTPDSPGESVEKGFNLTTLSIDSELGERPYEFDLPLHFSNKGMAGVELALSGILLGERNVLARDLSIPLEPGQSKEVTARIALPESVPAGRNRLTLRFVFSGDDRASPHEHVINLELSRNAGGVGSNMLLTAALALGAFLILAIAIIAVSRSLKARGGNAVKLVARREAEEHEAISTRVAASERNSTVITGQDTPAADDDLLRSLGASQRTDSGSVLSDFSTSTKKEARSITRKDGPTSIAHRDKRSSVAETSFPRINASGEPIRVEFVVESQNPAIGLRNVCWMRPGQRKSIGGGASDFLVYLVEMPSRIAYVAYDGEAFVVAPAKPELFPGLEGSSVRIGFDESLSFISPKGYEMRMKFRPYVSAIERINSILLSLKVEGSGGTS